MHPAITPSLSAADHKLLDRLELLYSNAFSGLLITIIAATGLAFGLDPGAEAQTKAGWWLCICTVCILRLTDVFVWQRRVRSGHQGSRADLYRFRIGGLITACLWSGYCLYFFQYASIFELLASIVIVSAMAGGACTVLSADRPLAIAYTQILLVPYSLQLAMSGETEHRLLGFLGLAFAVVMLSTAIKAARFTLASVDLRYEHEQLLSNMHHEVERRTEQVVELSQTDALTGLLNRSAFLDAAKRFIELHERAQFSLFFIDLDGFKPVNDNFGHQAGDEVLSELSARLQGNFPANTLICRWGGDEFIVLSKVITNADIGALSRRVKQIVRQPFLVDDNKIDLSDSIGVALYPQHSQQISELISYADVAMYSNKHTLKNDFVLFNADLAEQVRREYTLSAAIRSAVLKDQLRVHYQPIIDSKTGHIHAVEALMRWQLEDELIAPGVFIPLAEKNGAIRELGYWILEQAMYMQKRLSNQGLHLHVCVNVSIAQFEDANFVHNVERLLYQHAVNAQDIHLELTESVFSTNRPKLLTAIKALQKMGFAISIDDFGTGYSSLSVIQDLRVNVVKIDRSFIQQLNSNGGAIVKAVMMMSRELDYRVVAEGIEADEQAHIVKQMGIDYQQGFLHAHPMEEAALVQLLQSNAKAASSSQAGS